MSVKSHLASVMISGAFVALLMGSTQAGAATAPSTLAVCVKTSSGVIRVASSCKTGEVKSTLATTAYVQSQVATRATTAYVQSQVATRAPKDVSLGIPTAVRPAASMSASPSFGASGLSMINETTVPLTELAGNSVRTYVYHYTIPNLYGDMPDDDPNRHMTEVEVPGCQSAFPIPVQVNLYSTNYQVSPFGTGMTVSNASGALAMWTTDTSLLANNLLSFLGDNAQFEQDGPVYRQGVPTDGDMDLYVIYQCISILEAQ